MNVITEEMLSVLDQSAGPIGWVECVEISHPNWPAILRYVVNSSEPLKLTHEDGQTFEYVFVPLTINRGSDEDNLDQKLTATIGDVGTVIPDLIKLILSDEEILPPVLNYRAYVMGRYDVPTYVVKGLEVVTVTRDWHGSSFEAQAPDLNDSGTGEIYSASTDPSLEGFYS
ncbi:DUF1833 family protein [Acinetobacter nosocomialis]|uniref:DUF1833 family protein n=1 Tax=Acinetobacter nosocomialis TaxID=106654 RepID=UPI0039884DE5